MQLYWFHCTKNKIIRIRLCLKIRQLRKSIWQTFLIVVFSDIIRYVSLYVEIRFHSNHHCIENDIIRIRLCLIIRQIRKSVKAEFLNCHIFRHNPILAISFLVKCSPTEPDFRERKNPEIHLVCKLSQWRHTTSNFCEMLNIIMGKRWIKFHLIINTSGVIKYARFLGFDPRLTKLRLVDNLLTRP